MTTPSPNDMNTFAAWLTAAMTTKYGAGRGAAAQLAADSGISEQSISRYRRGVGGTPTPSIIKKLAQSLDASVTDALRAAGLVVEPDEATTTPSAAMINALRREAKDLPPMSYADLEREILAQVGMMEDYIQLSVERLRREADSDAPDTDNGVGAS